jgi:hypothetical protein
MKAFLLLVPLLLSESTSTRQFDIEVRKESGEDHQIALTYRTEDGQSGARSGKAPFKLSVHGSSLDLRATQTIGEGEFTVSVRAGDKYSGSGSDDCEVRVKADRRGINITTADTSCVPLRRASR